MKRLGNPMIGLQTVYEGGVVAGLTDAQLLERFARGDGEGATAAFAVLVERHGPMVMRVCRASIGDQHDAEDAFQAVFLVLARRARSVWARDSLAPWLHVVARRTSTRVRTRNERRRRLEHRLAAASVENDEARGIDADLVRAIHEEVGRLPDRFREAVVLCDLEGCSHEEAAGRLGWPIGTVKSRQARGRARLRARLSRRGLAPMDHAVAAALRSCPVSPASIHATVRAATLFKAGGVTAAGAVSAASTLARGVLGAMTMSALKSGIFVVLICGAVVAGGVSIVHGMRAGEERAGRHGPDGPPASTVPEGPRPPAGSLFAMRFAADPKHDGEAAGPAYRWAKLGPGAKSWMEGLITRNEGDEVLVALKPDPQNLTERDLLAVRKTRVEGDHAAIEFRLTPDGARRFGELTRAHLPEEGGVFRYRLALIVEGDVVALPSVLSEISQSGVIEFGGKTKPEPMAFDRIIKLLAGAAAYNNPPTARAVKDRAEAVHEAKAVDLPALAGADRVVIEPIPTGYRSDVRKPRDVQDFVRALGPTEKPAEGGALAATLWFYRGDELLKKVWVREGGEWGFERPEASWTTGADPALWRLVKARLGRVTSVWERVWERIF